jgi:transcriptional regulator with XRE-family HTH domain
MQTIGERLEEARKRKGVSIREAAEATKIRGDYLQKFENNQFDIGLTEIYVRGFIGIYATFLRLPADRLVSDYRSLGHSPAKPRPVSREVYGRMDLSVSGGEDRPERAPAAEPPPPEPARTPAGPARISRGPGGGVPAEPAVNQKQVFLGLIGLAVIVALLLIIWIAKELFGGSGREVERAAPALASAPVAPASGSVLSLVALRPVQLTVARQADGSELFAGDLAAGDRHDFPNTDLLLTTSAVDALQIEYRGARFSIGGADFHGPRTSLHLAPMR